MDKVLHFDESNFASEVLSSDKPVLVDFWAEWCGPCHMLAPTVHELAEEYDGKIKVGKLNVDENQATAAQYGVMSIPTLILFKDGKELTRLTGVRPKSHIAETLNYFLGQQVEA
ncbi:MAG: thioredoxin [Calditrichaeota bacterium]|nr:MAG: thioredoxin [Calditrichota bacterium]